jgi:nicotinamide riboside kinase
MVREVARRCPLPINRDTNVAAQSWILHAQAAEELEAENAHAVVLCDRSVLDNYCYLLAAAGAQPALEPFIAWWLTSYALLVKVPMWTTPRWDGVRDTDLAFQRHIDELLEAQLVERKLDPVRLARDDRPHWGDAVMARLEPLVCPIPSLFPEEEQAQT